MQTDKIRVKNDGSGVAAALDEVAKFSDYEGLNKKSALRLRLLAEETMGMVKAITGDFEGDFWLDGSKDDGCRIHLLAETQMDYDKKRELIEVSSDKANASAKGFMGKIREMMENSLYGAEEIEELNSKYGDPYLTYGLMGVHDPEFVSLVSYTNQWSLSKYRQSIAMAKDTNQNAEEAWDELEKSIVASIADDVIVGVKKNTAELVIKYTCA